MAENSKIQWCDHTFNPWMGCTKVSPGCANCYAEQMMDKRLGKVNWGPGNPRQRTSEANWKQVERWNVDAEMEEERYYEYLEEAAVNPDLSVVGKPYRPRVFVASLADWLDPEVPIPWLAHLLCLINDCPYLDFLMLTKRPERWEKRLQDILVSFEVSESMDRVNRATLDNLINLWLAGSHPENVWIGTSVEDQERAEERIPELLRIPAKVRFLSCEPLLGPVDLTEVATGPSGNGGKSYTNALYCPAELAEEDEFNGAEIDWVIVGGESGPNARGCKLSWINSIVRQCQEAGKAVFVKQLGAKPLVSDSEKGAVYRYPGIKDRSGGDWREWPSHLKVRQFPEGVL